MPTAKDNKYLTVRSTVVLTPIIEKTIILLDPFFAGLPSTVTSGYRSPESQLRLIKQYCRDNHVDTLFPNEMRMNLNETRIYEGKTIYGWQLLWSKLLNIGIIINPPIEAEVLFDYISGGVNKKGITIKESVHSKGLAFDISGGEDHDPSNELARVKQALEAKLPGLKGYTLERKNNCLHVDCEEPGKRVTLTVGGVEHTLLEV